jgi:membrane-associated phospholipid phosphatase
METRHVRLLRVDAPTGTDPMRSPAASGIVALLAVVAFAAVTVLVEVSGTVHWDRIVMNHLELLFGKASSTEMNTVWYMSFVVPALGGLAAIVCLAAARFRQAVLWVLVVGGLLAADPLLKEVFRRPAISRLPGDYSFPSGSAMVSMGVAVLFVLTLHNWWRVAGAVVAAAFVVTFGAMIVEAQWHYPSDVIGGWLVAIAWVASSWLVVVAPHSARRRADATPAL